MMPEIPQKGLSLKLSLVMWDSASVDNKKRSK